ncbi:MAG: ABC transporter permease [Spirochaetales bacterium]|nr:ABC transporter permease [Spirochaetales bacterium]
MTADILAVLTSPEFLSSLLRLATPLLIATMGSIFVEKSGILFLGLEGFMLIGAFFGFVGGVLFNPWVGLLFAVLAALILGLIFAFFTVSLAVDQVVVSLAVNLFSLGVTSSFLRLIFGLSTSRVESEVFKPIAIPLLSRIPWLGAVFNMNGFTYLGLLMVPVVYIIFFKTDWGLRIRAVGENPKAAETMGVKVRNIKYTSILWASAFAGLGGASLTLGDLGLFTDNMVAGKGFIGFAAIVLGRFHPVWVMVTVLFFGMVEAFELNLQAMGSSIPYQFPLMLPYLLTLIAFLIAGSGLAPKAWGKPFIAGDE